MQKELAALRKEMKEQKEESAQIALQQELAAMRKELKEQKEKTTKCKEDILNAHKINTLLKFIISAFPICYSWKYESSL